jgi:tetratricopeptide (TPR) repeat protein
VEKNMWEYKGTSQFDIGAGYGVLEYDFFTINGEEEFGSIIDYSRHLWGRFADCLEGDDPTENNTSLSPNVQAKMKEYNANLCLTFLKEEYKENNVRIRPMIVNEQKQNGTFDTSRFYFFFLKRNNVLRYVQQASSYTKRGFNNAAVAYYSEAIELDSDSAFLYSVRGDAYRYMEKYDRAIVDYTQAIQLDPNDSRTYCNRGIALASKDSDDEAFRDFFKAIELNPDDDYAYINRAMAYQAKGNYDSAKADFLKALEIAPHNKVVKKYLESLNKERIQAGRG